MRKNIFVSLFSLSLLIPGLALAQVERLPGVVDKPAPGLELDQKKLGTPSVGSADTKKPADANAVVGTFRDISFSGLTVISESDLKEIAAEYLNRPMTKGDLVDLKAKLTRAFYDKGYILVKVITPQQNASSGVLKVEIYEAEVGEIRVIDENGVLNSRISRSFSNRFGQNEVFSDTASESVVSDLNELKNVAANLSLQPGKRFKTTDLNVVLSEADEDNNYVTFDNYGSELTGRNVGTLHLEHSNALNLGETLYGNFRKSTEDLWSAGVGVVTPIGIQNIKFELSGLRSENEIGDRLVSLDAEGETNQVVAAFSKNFLNTTKTKVTSRAGIEVRNHKSFLAGALDTKDKIRQLFVESSALRKVEGGIFYASARLSKGIDVLDASTQGQANASRARGDQEAIIFQPLLLANFRPEVIPGVPAINGEVKALVTGQFSSNTLLSSDLMVAGGYGSVRGFDVAQETGENGYQFTLEYGHFIPVHEDWRVKFGPFVDGATVYNRVPGSVEDKNLYAAGLGLEAKTNLVPTGETRFRFDFAQTLGDYTSAQVDDNIAYFSVTQSF